MSALIVRDILNVKRQKQTTKMQKDGKRMVRMFSSRWISRTIFILPLNISSYWRLAVVSHFSVFCWRQLLICKAAWSYVPFHIFSQACVTFQLTLLQAAALFRSLALRAECTGTGQHERSGFSRWARLVGCKGLCRGTKLFVDGSGAILCYTDTLPSAADSANSVLALVLCLKYCLSYSQWTQWPQETSIFEPIFVISVWQISYFANFLILASRVIWGDHLPGLRKHVTLFLTLSHWGCQQKVWVRGRLL